MNLWGAAADAVVAVHMGYVLFTVGGALLIIIGGIAGWKWVRRRAFRIVHLVAVLIVAAEALAGIWCPLTVWEWQLREKAGQVYESDISFVGRLIRHVIFIDLPDWGFTVMYVAFGLLVAAMLLFVRPERRKHKIQP